MAPQLCRLYVPEKPYTKTICAKSWETHFSEIPWKLGTTGPCLCKRSVKSYADRTERKVCTTKWQPRQATCTFQENHQQNAKQMVWRLSRDQQLDKLKVELLRFIRDFIIDPNWPFFSFSENDIQWWCKKASTTIPTQSKNLSKSNVNKYDKKT